MGSLSGCSPVRAVEAGAEVRLRGARAEVCAVQEAHGQQGSGPGFAAG